MNLIPLHWHTRPGSGEYGGEDRRAWRQRCLGVSCNKVHFRLTKGPTNEEAQVLKTVAEHMCSDELGRDQQQPTEVREERAGTADTTYLKYKVEEYVRNALQEEYGVAFTSKILTLSTGGTHEFDAVSEDGTVVAAIRAAGGKTSRGRLPSGKMKSAEAELYYLCLVSAPVRMLVLTSPEFYEIMRRRLEGRLAPVITLKLIQLPPEIQSEVDRIHRIASLEVGG